MKNPDNKNYYATKCVERQEWGEHTSKGKRK